ncbi:hypothetical protein [Methylobacterium indicum]|uniref:Uncharacterized protein n=1 Tax=Methylobacterium indicum TaxID=1775910 RepID=A0ABR5HEW0_9HYPH|nr:hypothetical protein [Methylobacterium indicum]KMO18901.1 hypothetical protein QR78_14425 [Methylobacterium indicum]KMO25059.1 hypothetical protein QR79_09815 [Methylobacterium indicum]
MAPKADEIAVVDAAAGTAPAGAYDMADELLPESEWFSPEERAARDAEADDFEIDWSEVPVTNRDTEAPANAS